MVDKSKPKNKINLLKNGSGFFPKMLDFTNTNALFKHISKVVAPTQYRCQGPVLQVFGKDVKHRVFGIPKPRPREGPGVYRVYLWSRGNFPGETRSWPVLGDVEEGEHDTVNPGMSIQNTSRMYWYPSPDSSFMILQTSSPVFAEASHCSFSTSNSMHPLNKSTARGAATSPLTMFRRCSIDGVVEFFLWGWRVCPYHFFVLNQDSVLKTKERFLYMLQGWRDFLVILPVPLEFHWRKHLRILRTSKSAFHRATKDIDWSWTEMNPMNYMYLTPTSEPIWSSERTRCVVWVVVSGHISGWILPTYKLYGIYSWPISLRVRMNSRSSTNGEIWCNVYCVMYIFIYFLILWSAYKSIYIYICIRTYTYGDCFSLYSLVVRLGIARRRIPSHRNKKTPERLLGPSEACVVQLIQKDVCYISV